MGQALEKALAVIHDEFRPERKEWQARINQACRVREMVQSHIATFPEALEKLEARVDWMEEAFALMSLDNIALNEKHGVELFQLRNWERDARDWLVRVTGGEG